MFPRMACCAWHPAASPQACACIAAALTMPASCAPVHRSSAGMYLGSFGPHGPELLHVERQMEGGQEYVVATKLTGALLSGLVGVGCLWAACWKVN